MMAGRGTDRGLLMLVSTPTEQPGTAQSSFDNISLPPLLIFAYNTTMREAHFERFELGRAGRAGNPVLTSVRV